MNTETLQPSADAVATRIAVAYEIVETCGHVHGDATAVARLVGEVIRTMWDAEETKK